jgi:hypothetical protein
VSIKDKIRSSADMARESITVDEWDVTLEVRSMSARQRAKFASSFDQGATTDRIETLWRSVLTSCCFDPETNELLFDDSDMEWLLNEKSGVVVDRIVNACLEVSGLKEKSVDEAGKVSSDSPTNTDAPILNADSISS